MKTKLLANLYRFAGATTLALGTVGIIVKRNANW